MSRAKLVTVIPFLATMPLLSVQARAQCRINEAFELVGSNAPAGFGRSVAVDGDVAVVGESRIGTSGAAYVYRFDGTTWIEEAELLPSEGPEDALFGWSVDVSGDVVVVGGIAITGSTFPVHVFRYDGLDWEEEAKLRGSDPHPSGRDAFGQSVSVDGDVVAVGAPTDDGNAGAAYVFRFGETGWQEEIKLFSSDLEAADNFGTAVSVSNDTLLVGTPSDITDGMVHGSAYIYWFDGDKWIGEVKLTASDPSFAAHFGESVSIDGGVAVIGAPGSNDLCPGSAVCPSGAAYIYRFVGFIGWIEEAKLTAFDAAASDEFGCSVALSGNTAVIGVRRDDGDFQESGSAHVYRHDGIAWIEEAKLTASNAGESDELGFEIWSNLVDGGMIRRRFS